MVGKVKWFSGGRGYGFIDRGEEGDVFVHYTAIEAKGYRCLEAGDTVQYEIVESEDRAEAIHVVKL